MKIFRRGCCEHCGQPLFPEDAIKIDDKLYCKDWECIKDLFDDEEYSKMCRDFVEMYAFEQFFECVIEDHFEKARVEDVEYYENYEPECDYDD